MARKIVTIDMSPREYIPTEWKDDEKPWKLKVKPLSKRQLATYKDNSTRMNLQTNSFYFGTSVNAYEIFKSQVTGWENFPINYKEANGLVDEEVMNSIHIEDIEEVSNYIIKISTVGADELEK